MIIKLNRWVAYCPATNERAFFYHAADAYDWAWKHDGWWIVEECQC